MGLIFKIVILMSLVIILAIGVFIYNPILYPSYLSVKYACSETPMNLTRTGWIVAGMFIEKETGTNLVVYDQDPKTLIHEQCHKQQYEQHRLFDCNHQILKYINELECYSREYI